MATRGRDAGRSSGNRSAGNRSAGKPDGRKPAVRKPAERRAPGGKPPKLRGQVRLRDKPDLRGDGFGTRRGKAGGPGKRDADRRGPGKSRGPKARRAIKVTPIAAPAAESDGKLRLNRFLASSGVCSRRAADEYIVGGRVTVNGEPTTQLGTRVDPDADDVRVDGSRVQVERKVYILFNKPKDVVCTNATNEQRRRVVDYLPQVRGRVYTVGRLDTESQGLILVTNDGDFAQHVAHPRYGLAKTYAVLVSGRVDDEKLKKARGGVWLSEGRTSGARIAIERRGRDRTYLKVSIKEGRNREIRRIFAQLEHPVISLKRVRIGPLTLHGLGSGRWRFLHRDEVAALMSITREGGDGAPHEGSDE